MRVTEKAIIEKSGTIDWYVFRTPFSGSWKEEIKKIPSSFRKWNPLILAWEIHTTYFEEAVKVTKKYFPNLEQHIFEDEKQEQAKVDLFAELFKIVPADQVDRMYKLLAQVFHPDTGGDPEKMKELNKAYEDRSK